MQKKIMVGAVGENSQAIFLGIREFPTEKVVLIAEKNQEAEASKLQEDLKKIQIPSRVEYIGKPLWEEMFRVLSDIKKVEENQDILINVSSGTQVESCALTSAAFVNGLKAIAVEKNEVVLLPVLKFSYYKILTNKKMDILKYIYNDAECCASLEELSKKTNMSLPLVSYHINGNLKSEGLKELGLVETMESNGRVGIGLTTMGRMLIKGYL